MGFRSLACCSKLEKVDLINTSLIFSISHLYSSKSKFQHRISSELELPSLPEMVFGNSALQIDHSAGFGIHFNALDALKLVDNKHDLMKVAVAEEWQNSRWEKNNMFL